MFSGGQEQVVGRGERRRRRWQRMTWNSDLGILIALQELSGVQETEVEMEEIMKHVDALAIILSTGKKLVSSNIHI